MKKLAVGVGTLIVLGLGWFFVSPLFIDETVDESFDFAAPGGGVDIKKIMAMPSDEREAARSHIMEVAAAAPDSTMVEPMPPSAPVVIARGEFVDADAVHKGSGSATVYTLADQSHVVRFEDFHTTNGPALVVYLAKHSSPERAADVTDGGYIKLGNLKGNVGNQNYPVPGGIDIDEYNSVVIWCELFGVLFSPAALTRT